MAFRPLTQDDLETLDWSDLGDGWYRIVADVTCGQCGAYQAADSDPTPDKATTMVLCVRLFNQAGWRVNGGGVVLCSACASNMPGA